MLLEGEQGEREQVAEDHTDGAVDRADHAEGEHLGDHHLVAMRLGKQGRGQGLVPKLLVEYERAEHDGEDVGATCLAEEIAQPCLGRQPRYGESRRLGCEHGRRHADTDVEHDADEHREPHLRTRHLEQLGGDEAAARPGGRGGDDDGGHDCAPVVRERKTCSRSDVTARSSCSSTRPSRAALPMTAGSTCSTSSDPSSCAVTTASGALT